MPSSANRSTRPDDEPAGDAAPSPARDALLAKAMGHVASHGLSDVSLRELATAIGTSHRMLIYHFGGREGLVAAIVAEVEADQRRVLAELAESATSPRQLIEAQWARLTDPALRPFVALFFEVLALAVHDRPGTAGFLDGLTEPWLALAADVADRMGVEHRDDELRLGVAVSRGLLVDVLASGDVEGPTASLHRFLDLWEAAPP
jgi:AcrR family transcriptional regulator